jgi:hypothetical protein
MFILRFYFHSNERKIYEKNLIKLNSQHIQIIYEVNDNYTILIIYDLVTCNLCTAINL